MKKNKKDTPLTVKVSKDELIISIGIDTLAFCAEHCPRFEEYDEEKGEYYSRAKIDDKVELAKDIRLELLREQEDGTTPLHILLDDCLEKAFDNGSLGFKEESYR